MFNNQELYSKPMLVQMDLSRHQYNNTPKGLSGFGPGLGVDGEPLRGVRTHIELQPIKNLLIQEIVKLKEKTSLNNVEQPVNINPGQTETNIISPFQQNPVPVVNVNPFIQQNPLLNLTSLVNPQGLQNIQLLQNLIQQNASVSDNQLSLASMQNQMLHMQNIVQPNTSAAGASSWSSAVPSGDRQSDNSQQYGSRTESKARRRSNSFDEVRRNVGKLFVYYLLFNK